jgi:putative peptidoglycan lipid II flippase
MSIKSIFSSKITTDFIYMFSSNIIKKLFGFLREIILAFFFGSSLLYANYLFLKTATDFFSQFTLGSALQANIMPKFTKLYSNKTSVDISNVFNFSKYFSLKLFVFSLFIQIPLIFYINPESIALYFVLSVLLGIVLSVNFFNSIFLTILQAKGNFKKHSIATSLNISLSTLLLYPFTLFFGIIGVIFSRLSGAITLAIIYIRPLLSVKGDVKANLSINDLNFSILILGNFANIIMFSSRFISGADGSNNIAFYTYAIIFLNVFLTAVIMNINTLVLKIISVKRDYKIILISTLISTLVGGLFVFLISSFSFEIVSFVFERGAFSSDDTLLTSSYINDICWSFLFMFIASALFQPYFTLPQSYLNKKSKFLARPFLFAIILLFIYFYFNSHGVRFNSLVMIYTLSFISFILSIIAFVKYYRYEI